jgi:hypothetical protein
MIPYWNVLPTRSPYLFYRPYQRKGLNYLVHPQLEKAESEGKEGVDLEEQCRQISPLLKRALHRLC